MALFKRSIGILIIQVSREALPLIQEVLIDPAHYVKKYLKDIQDFDYERSRDKSQEQAHPVYRPLSVFHRCDIQGSEACNQGFFLSIYALNVAEYQCGDMTILEISCGRSFCLL